jgi:hypothetical protein
MIKPLHLLACSVLLLGSAASLHADDAPAPAPAAPAAPAAADPAKDNKDATLDELLNIPGKKPAAKPDDKAPAAPKPEKEPPGVKASDDAPPAGDPFKSAVEDMKQAATRLGAEDTGLDTQRAQERAVRRLDQLISQLKPKKQKPKDKPKSRDKDQGSEENEGQQEGDAQAQAKSQGKSQKPGTEAANGGLGPAAEEARLKQEEMNEKLAEWGNLPPRLRDQLLQGMEDRFSNLYREMTEKYYRRLAEQNK